MRRFYRAGAAALAAATALVLSARANEITLDATGRAEAGQKITAANKAALKGAIPDAIAAYVNDYADLDMTIVSPEQYPPNPKYVEATAKYACQATIDAVGMIQNYTAGQPFPYSEWAKAATEHRCDLKTDDPQFGLKLAWNVNFRWQGPGLNVPHFGLSYMRNEGKETWRIAQGEYRRTYFSHRADLLPASDKLDPKTEVEWAEFFDVKDPFDLRGTKYLLFRYNRADREDETFAYVPALRRVRRLAATQKADSLLGTEFTLEDFYLFAGYVWNHTWEAKGESEYLAALNSKRTCFPSNIGEAEAVRDEGMTRLGSEKEWGQCRFGPYNTLPFIDETWQKRTVFQLDDVPQREGHPYSRKTIWYDKETMMPLYQVAYDRAGQPLRVAAIVYRWSENSVIEANKGQQVLNIAQTMILNVQNKNSHVAQFDNSNARVFTVSDSQTYYDTSRLKRGN